VRRPHEEEKLVVDRDLHGKRHLLINRTDITDDASERNEERETKERKEKRKEDALDTLEALLEINEAIERLDRRIEAWNTLEDHLKRDGKLDASKREVYDSLVRLGYINAGDSIEDAQRVADSIDQEEISEGRKQDIEDRNRMIEVREEMERNPENKEALQQARQIQEQKNYSFKLTDQNTAENPNTDQIQLKAMDSFNI